MAVTDLDERLHPVQDPSPHWSDSLYFNAWDPASGAFLMTRMAVLANEPRVTGGVLCWIDGVPAYGYGRELGELPATDWDAMSVGGLDYRMLQANREWLVRLDDGDDRAHLTWAGFTGVFDYADNEQPLPRAVAWGHYEQTCTVRGDLHVAGRRIAFDGVGQRDHSWGHRDWGGLAEWHWITGFFGTRCSFNLFHVCTPGGDWTVNGFVHRDGRDVAIAGAERTTREGDGRSPEGYELVLALADGSRLELGAEAGGVEVPVRPHEGATVVHEVPMRLRSSDGLDGFGIYELLENSRR
ncbi:MAG: hypothetical protein IPM45_04345 [Acidimicrobiales bacterium]|nr:hypothetical protein [Acidimicrobiales bacterium]